MANSQNTQREAGAAQEGDAAEAETSETAPVAAATDTPEFARAVDEAVQKLLPELTARLLAALPAGKPAGDHKDFVGALALQLAELTGQGQGRIYVAPEIVEKRRRAMEGLTSCLIELQVARRAARSDAEREAATPIYQLKNQVFLNVGKEGEVLIDPLYRDNDKIVRPVDIDWLGIPNLSMEPLNPAARRVFRFFCETIGHQGGAAAPDELLALTSAGAVVRGAAAAAILRNDKARELGEPGREGNTPDHLPVAAIRRRDQAPTTKIQVLGTLAAPVEIS